MHSLSLFSQTSFFFKRFTNPVTRSIVYGYIPQRSPFDKTSYIEKYVPRPTKYHKTRKPRLAQWTNPSVEWPILLPPPTKLTGRPLLRSLENVEKRRIIKNRTFKVVAVRPGDVVQFKYYLSLSEKKFNIYSGLVIGRCKKNSLEATIRVLFRFCGSLVEMNLKKYSPYLADFKVLGRGRVHKAKLYKMASLGLTHNELCRPIIKGKKMDKDEKKLKSILVENKTFRPEKMEDPLLKSLKIEKEFANQNK